MSERKSFWTTLPGFVTGLAGLLTAIVGLVTVLIQLDVIGGDDAGGVGSTTTVAGATGGAGAGTASTQAATFSVSPTTLDFKPTDPREKTVTVRNTSDAATLTLSELEVTGQDADRFSASRGTCSGPVRPGLSCEMRVTFAPSGPLRSYSALLQVTSDGGRGEEVRLTASTIL